MLIATRRHDSVFSAILTGLLDLLGARRPRLPHDVRADGEQILVTGASRGLGLSLTKALTARGARVWMVCRSRALEAPAEVRTAVPGADVDVVQLDLMDAAAVEQALDELGALGRGFDRVVLNAGMVPRQSRIGPAGLDVMVHVNFVANVQLIRGLRRRGLLKPGARIVVVGSDAHRFAPAIDVERWMEPRDYPTSHVIQAYGWTKRLLHTWAEALAKDAPEHEVVHLCPGAIATDIAREAPGSLKVVVGPLMRLFFPSPARVAAWVSWAVLSPDFNGRTGIYLHLGVEKAPGEGVRDPDLGSALWNSADAVVDRMTGEES